MHTLPLLLLAACAAGTSLEGDVDGATPQLAEALFVEVDGADLVIATDLEDACETLTAWENASDGGANDPARAAAWRRLMPYVVWQVVVGLPDSGQPGEGEAWELGEVGDDPWVDVVKLSDDPTTDPGIEAFDVWFHEEGRVTLEERTADRIRGTATATLVTPGDDPQPAGEITIAFDATPCPAVDPKMLGAID